MWNNYFNRPRRDLPRPNYNESSEDEYDSPLVSPARPPPTRAGSPVELAVPTLNDNVDEDLEIVSQTLRNVGHTHAFRGTRPDPEGVEQGEASDPVVEEEEVVQGLVVQEASGNRLKADNDRSSSEDDDNSANMANYDTEDKEDGDKAQELARSIKV